MLKDARETASSVLLDTYFGCPAGCGQMTPDGACYNCPGLERRYATITRVLLFFEYR